MARSSGSNSSRRRTTSPFLMLVRWLSMMLRASSASLWCTAIRTSPRLSTESGNTAWAPVDTTDMTPCASSRLRTTRASISEGVRKMITSSGNGFAHIVHLQQDHRHVVVLRRFADKRGDLAQNALAQLVGRQVRMALDELTQAALAEQILVCVHRLADAVGEEQVEIARRKRNGV